jgi:hypothetical protein
MLGTKPEHEIEIQETHTTQDLNLLNRGKLSGFKLIGAIYSNVYGSGAFMDVHQKYFEIRKVSSEAVVYLKNLDVDL